MSARSACFVGLLAAAMVGCGGSGGPDPLVELPGADSQIAFVHNDDEIWILNADGGSRRLVDGAATNPAWSPHGKRIAFERASDRCVGSCPAWRVQHEHDIWVVNADGTGEERLTDRPGDNREPAWSPDGRRIVFGGDGNLFVMNADGSGVRALTTGSADDRNPTWSPDGRWIVFSSDGPNVSHWSSDLWLVHPDGSGVRRLTRSAGLEAEPNWSPDGRRIASAGYSYISVVNADGSNLVRLTRPGARKDSSPVWSPNGRWIVFDRLIPGYKPFCCGIYGLWLVDADGGKPKQITEGGDSEPNWRPGPSVP